MKTLDKILAVARAKWPEFTWESDETIVGICGPRDGLHQREELEPLSLDSIRCVLEACSKEERDRFDAMNFTTYDNEGYIIRIQGSASEVLRAPLDALWNGIWEAVCRP